MTDIERTHSVGALTFWRLLRRLLPIMRWLG
jgi:hypothetical protein